MNKSDHAMKNNRDFRSNISCLSSDKLRIPLEKDGMNTSRSRGPENKYHRNLLTSFEMCELV